ncbi:SixA phosphatase family protein [Micromonospora sp. SH-82]|uniref:SixA phosphatase family protein n=1 Tax=Micromonospora sp. SH-82 TaxID=3132938 RepID=UPI003EBDF656
MTDDRGRNRTLVLLRHAKAETPGEEILDVDRPLVARGRAAAVAVGTWLDRYGLRPDVVLCSPALRTRQTWAGVADGLTRQTSAGATDGPAWRPSAGAADGPGAGSGSSPQGDPTHSDPDVRYEPDIYEALPGTLLTLIRSVPAEASTVLLVAHNPGVSLLSGLLDPTRPMHDGLSTAELAVHRTRGAWADLSPGDATLVERSRPT